MRTIKAKTDSNTDNGKPKEQVSSTGYPDLVEYYKDSAKQLSAEVDNLKQEQNNLSVNIKTLEKDLGDYKTKFIEIFSIFVALFTFVSFEIQIFKSDQLSVFSVLGFTLIILGSLIFFIILLKNSISEDDKKSAKMLLVSIFTIIFGVFFIAMGDEIIQALLSHNSDLERKVNENFITNNENISNLKKCLVNSKWFDPKCLKE